MWFRCDQFNFSVGCSRVRITNWALRIPYIHASHRRHCGHILFVALTATLLGFVIDNAKSALLDRYQIGLATPSLTRILILVGMWIFSIPTSNQSVFA
jgi:hypothetical protein